MNADYRRGFADGWNAARSGVEDLLDGDIEGTQFEAPMQAKAPVAQKKPRKKSAWQKYMGQKKNQIKFKSGPKKGRLNLSKMSRAYKRSRKGRR